MKFMPYTGDLMGLPTNENHINFLWCEPGCKVLFSATRHGNAMSCHFASDKNGMLKIESAINEFVLFLFVLFDWCEAILAIIKLKKVRKIVIKCGFSWVKSFRKSSLYIRRKEWVI